MMMAWRRLRRHLGAVLLVPAWLIAAAPASAEILFQEDFNDGNLSSRGWYDIARWGTELLLSTTEGVNGPGALEVRYQTGSTGPWMRHNFRPSDRIYSRYYRKWASNWQFPDHGSGPHDTYLFANYGQPFVPTQTHLTVYTDSIYMGAPDWQYGSVGLETRRILQGESYRTLTSLNPPTPRFQLNRWYCIETLATMNTPGSANGSIQLWLDGVLMFDVRNLVLRNPEHASLQFEVFMFGPYYHIGVPYVQSTWMDALVIADERVGCLGGGDTDPPAPPTNLQVSMSP